MKFEIEIIKSLQAFSSPLLDGIFKFISQLGNYIGFLIVFIILFLFCNKKFAIYFSLTYIFSILFNFALKFLIARPRPYDASYEIKNIYEGSGLSMPSGHTLSATIIACFCLFYVFSKCKKNWEKICFSVFFTIFVFFVIVSRMYLGQHYLSDTLVGLIEGILFSSIGILLLKKSKTEGKSW